MRESLRRRKETTMTKKGEEREKKKREPARVRRDPPVEVEAESFPGTRSRGSSAARPSDRKNSAQAKKNKKHPSTPKGRSADKVASTSFRAHLAQQTTRH